MRRLRLLGRTVALGLVTLPCLVALLLGLPVAMLLGRTARWRGAVTGVWSRLLLGILGARLEVVGEPPRGGFLLVSNHLSYVDIPVLAATLGCTFVSKAEVRSWPVLGFLSRVAGTIFIDRERRRDVKRVGSEMRAHLEGGGRLAFFPEGTSTSGAEVAPFRSSLLEPAATLSLPVCFAVLRYRTPQGEPPASEAVAWWGDMEFAPHITGLLGLRGFRARVEFGATPVREADRKVLAQRLWEEVRARFQPMPQGDGTAPAGREVLSGS